MAPHSSHSTEGPEASVTSSDRTSLLADRSEARGVQSEAGTLTFRHKVALCAGLMASDAMGVFSNLGEMPLQQTLGTPVYLLTFPGAVSASSALLLVPLMGWIADRGSHPRQRKVLVTIIAFCIGFLGLGLNLSAVSIAASKPATNTSNTTVRHYNGNVAVQGEPQNQSLVERNGNASMKLRTTSVAEEGLETPGWVVEDVSGVIPLSSSSSSSSPPPPPPRSSRLPGWVVEDESEVTPVSSQATVQTVQHGIWGLSVPAVLSMLGFILMDLSFDLTNSAVKALVLSHSAPVDHVTLLVTGVFMAALGGCFTSVSGVVDISGVLPDVDPVLSQTMLQLASLILLCFLSCTCSVLTAKRVTSHADVLDRHRVGDYAQQKKREKQREVEGMTENRTSTPSLRLPKEGPSNVFYVSMLPGEAIMSNSTQLEHSHSRSLSLSVTWSRSQASNNLTSSDPGDEIRLLHDSHSSRYGATMLDEGHSTVGNNPASKKGCLLGSWKFNMFVLWLAAFFSGCSIFTFNVTIADFVGKVVYEGSPQAEAASAEYIHYQQGLRTAALCVLILNVAYVTSALGQNKVLTLMSPQTEYVLVNVSSMVLMMTMQQTGHLTTVYFTAIAVGLNRAALFTVPFVLATQLCCQRPSFTENKQESSALHGKERPSTATANAADDTSSSHLGSTMALMTSAVPSGYLVVNSIIGPLVDSTADPSSPMVMAILCSLMAALTVCCYRS